MGVAVEPDGHYMDKARRDVPYWFRYPLDTDSPTYTTGTLMKVDGEVVAFVRAEREHGGGPIFLVGQTAGDVHAPEVRAPAREVEVADAPNPHHDRSKT